MLIKEEYATEEDVNNVLANNYVLKSEFDALIASISSNKTQLCMARIFSVFKI